MASKRHSWMTPTGPRFTSNVKRTLPNKLNIKRTNKMAPWQSSSSTGPPGTSLFLPPSATPNIRMLPLFNTLTTSIPKTGCFIARSTETELLSSSWMVPSNTTKWVPPRLRRTSSALITPMAAMSRCTKYLAAEYSTLLLPRKAWITRMRLLLRSWVSRTRPPVYRELFM